MITCQLCLKKYRTVKFHTARISLCGHCVNSLNDSPTYGQIAEARIGELLRKGMHKRAQEDLNSEEAWKVKKAQETLDDFDAAYLKALPGWLNSLLQKASNKQHDFKALRAFRRGLILYTKPKINIHEYLGYKQRPSTWLELAKEIRKADQFTCRFCGATDRPLDVHHIMYLQNFGSNRKTNLISLCRPCHEEEHGRSFDEAENLLPKIQVSEKLELEETVTIVDTVPQSSPSHKSEVDFPPVRLVEPPKNTAEQPEEKKAIEQNPLVDIASHDSSDSYSREFQAVASPDFTWVLVFVWALAVIIMLTLALV